MTKNNETVSVITINGIELNNKQFTTLDLSRNTEGLNINITSMKQDFALNAFYDELLALEGERQGEAKGGYSVTITQGEHSISFDNMAIRYHASLGYEIINLSRMKPNTPTTPTP